MALRRDDPWLALQDAAGGPEPERPAPEEITPEARRRLSRRLTAERQSEAGRAFQQGLDNVHASGVAARGLLRSPFDKEGALRDFQRAQMLQEEAAEFGPRVQSLEDIEGVGDAFEWARNVALTQVPNIALAAGTGGTVGGVGRAVAGTVARRQGARALAEAGARAAVSRDGSTALRGAALRSSTARAAREQGARNAEDLARAQARGTAVGQAVGGAGAGTTLQAGLAPGIVLDEDPANTASFGERAGTAAVGALVTGSLEALPVMALLRRYGLSEGADQVTGNVVSRIAKQAARQGSQEAATEVAQTVGERLAHRYLNENIELVGPEAFSDYINAAAGGFVGGGLFGAPAGLRGVGRDSEAGRRYVQAGREYLSRFKRRPPPDRPAPGTPVSPSPAGPGPVDRVLDAARDLTSRVAAQASEARGRLETAANDVRERFKENLDALKIDDDVNNSFLEILDADGLNLYDRQGELKPGLTPAMNLADGRVAREWRAEGVGPFTAQAASMIPNVQKRRELLDSGALGEAAKVLQGADPETINDDLLTQFQDALGPIGDPRRNSFNRVAKTFYDYREQAEDIELPAEAVGQGNTRAAARGDIDGARTEAEAELRDDGDDTTGDSAETRLTYEEQQASETQRTPGARLREPTKASTLLSKPIPRGTPKDTIIFVNAKGERRGLTGKQLGRQIAQARADAESSASTARGISDRDLILEQFADMVVQGWNVEPESLRAMQLTGSTALTPATAAELRAALETQRADPDAFRLRLQTPNVPSQRPRTAEEQARLNREPGLAEFTERQGAEDPSRLDDDARILGPRRGSPLGMRATGGRLEGPGAEGNRRPQAPRTKRVLPEAPDTAPRVSDVRIQEGQTIDAEIDQDLARQEREQYPIENDDFNDLDRIIERVTGQKIAGDFDVRRDLYNQARRELRRQATEARARFPQQRESAQQALAELEDAAVRYGEAQYASALRAYQRNKNKKTYRRLVAARDAVTEYREQQGDRAQRPQASARRQAQIQDDAARAGGTQQSLETQIETRDGRPFAPTPDPFESVEAADAREARRAESAAALRDEASARRALDTVLGDTSNAPPVAGRAEPAPDASTPADPQTDAYAFTLDNAGIDAAVEAFTAARSKNAFTAMMIRVANSTLPATAKTKLIEKLGVGRAALHAAVTAAGVRQLERMGIDAVLDKPATHLEEFRAAIGGQTTLQGALRAVRNLPGVTAAQKRMIDALTITGFVEGAALVVEPVHGLEAVTGGNRTGQDGKSTVTARIPAGHVGRINDGVTFLLHEAIHAATTYAERTDPEARAAVAKMLAHARREAAKLGVDIESFYGLGETQEFLAETFSNPDFQALLARLPPANTKKFQSLWAEFKDFVRRLVGLSAKDTTLLDEVFTVGLDMMRTQRELAFADMFQTDVNNAPPVALPTTPAAGSKPSDYFSVMTPDNRRYFEAFFRRGDVFRRVKEALPASMHHELHSADKGPALLVNTGLAMAMSGQLKTEASPLRELWDTISKIVQVPTRAAYGRELLKNIQARGAVTRRGLEADAHKLTLTKPGVIVTRFVNSQIAPRVRALATDMNQRMRNSGVPAISQIATLISQRTGDYRADGMDSYAARHVAERNKRFNQFYDIIGKWDDEHRQAVGDALRSNSKPDGQVGVDAERVRAFYRDMRDYLVDAKVLSPGQNVEDYFPVAMDHERVVERRPAFLRLFSAPNIAEAARAADLRILKEKRAEAKTAKAIAHFDARIAEVTKMTHQQIAESWYQFASVRNPTPRVAGLTFAEGDVDPSFRPGNRRLMDFVYKVGTPAQLKQFAEFQDQQFDRVTAIYIARATKRAEWSRMNLSTRLAALMTEAANQGATPKQLQMAKDYIDQAMGAYGTDWHPWISRIAESFGVNLPPFASFQRLQAGLMTYHNLRLLPLALASSMIDPLGVMVRTGGEVGTAFASYRDAVRALRNEGGTDALRALAEDMGVIERHAVSEALSHLHGSPADPHGLSSRINQQLFRWNGLEFVTKFSRLAALAAGQRFLIKHGAGANETSLRYLRELNLVPSDIVVRDGVVVRNAKIDAALSRFVDESVVRPTGQQRPGWQNDPHFQWAAQYKGYLYSFWNTIARRGMLELGEGNPAVLAPLALYIPVQAMGEMARDALQGDDDDREWQDYAWMGVERSGLLGPKFDIGKNANEDLRRRSSVVNSLVGPTGQQLAHAYDVATGERSVGRFGRQALPLSTLHEDWFTRTEVDTDG